MKSVKITFVLMVLLVLLVGCSPQSAQNYPVSDSNPKPESVVQANPQAEPSLVDCGYAENENSQAYDCLLRNLENCNRAILTSSSQDTLIVNGRYGDFCSFTHKEYSDTGQCNFPISKLEGLDLNALSRLVGEFCVYNNP